MVIWRPGWIHATPCREVRTSELVADLAMQLPICSNGIPVATVKRLMSAVSFGYGIFHLAVSLLPPKLLHLINAFGFEGDRQTGIQGWVNEFNRLLRL